MGALLRRLMPDFLGIGAQRAGTTWLWTHLRRHPQIWMPRRKELHFFDRRLQRRRVPWIDRRLQGQFWYGINFLEGRVRGKRVGEITPAYATLTDKRVALLAQWIPQVRVMYLLRDPVQRAWSHAAKSYRKWAGQPLERANEESLRAFFRLPEVQKRGDYLTALQTWRRHIPAHQIFVCASEDMFRAPVPMLRQIFSFLGVDHNIALDPDDLGRRVHQGSAPPIPESVRADLEALCYPQQAALEALLERSLPWGR